MRFEIIGNRGSNLGGQEFGEFVLFVVLGVDVHVSRAPGLEGDIAVEAWDRIDLDVFTFNVFKSSVFGGTDSFTDPAERFLGQRDLHYHLDLGIVQVLIALRN